MYRKILFVASLMLASSVQAQRPSTPGTPNGTATGRVDAAPAFHITGDRGLLGKWPSASPVGGEGAQKQSSFRAEVRGDVTSTAWGEAEFGAVENPDHSSGAFVVSLGTCSQQGAILFTRRSGTPLEVGRYRISPGADGENEILALVITGRPTNPTGAFHGQSGWLDVTTASDGLITGRFQVEAIGYLAAEQQREDRRVSVSGSLSATTAGSSFRVCEEAA